MLLQYKITLIILLYYFSDITCDALPPDPHGKYFNATCTVQKTFYNESCQLECEFGYVANGDPVQTCQLNGNWSSHIHCIGETTIYSTFHCSSMLPIDKRVCACKMY